MLATTAPPRMRAQLDTDFELIRCVCGAVVGELIVPARVGKDAARGSDRRAPLVRRGTLLRIKCDYCRDTILKHHPDFKGVLPGRLLVMQTIDLAWGEVDPTQVAIFRDHVKGDRSGTRGGEGLPRHILEDALAIVRSGATADGC